MTTCSVVSRPLREKARDDDHLSRRLSALAWVALTTTIGAAGWAQAAGISISQSPTPVRDETMQQHSYLGMWVTADGRIRQERLPNGRYDAG